MDPFLLEQIKKYMQFICDNIDYSNKANIFILTPSGPNQLRATKPYTFVKSDFERLFNIGGYVNSLLESANYITLFEYCFQNKYGDDFEQSLFLAMMLQCLPTIQQNYKLILLAVVNKNLQKSKHIKRYFLTLIRKSHETVVNANGGVTLCIQNLLTPVSDLLYRHQFTPLLDPWRNKIYLDSDLMGSKPGDLLEIVQGFDSQDVEIGEINTNSNYLNLISGFNECFKKIFASILLNKYPILKKNDALYQPLKNKDFELLLRRSCVYNKYFWLTEELIAFKEPLQLTFKNSPSGVDALDIAKKNNNMDALALLLAHIPYIPSPGTNLWEVD